MLFNNQNEDHSYWISFTDLVSGFMVVFIVVSLLSLNAKKPDPEPKAAPPILEKNEINGRYKEWIENFQRIIKKERWQAIEVADSATIRFSVRATSPEPLFKEGSSTPTAYFDKILFQFLPYYLSELHQLYLKQDSFIIREIRIEGHTDSRNGYISNLKLSSERALAIQEKLLKYCDLKGYDSTFKAFIEKNSIACGYSYSRRLDKFGKYLTSPEMVEDYAKSRRVELRILLDYQNKNK